MTWLDPKETYILLLKTFKELFEIMNDEVYDGITDFMPWKFTGGEVEDNPFLKEMGLESVFKREENVSTK